MKKIYNITGFDCANCAAKTEKHLSLKDEIESCRIDFAQNKLYINFKGEPLTIDEILNYIKEVETDNIQVSENTTSEFKKIPLFTKKMKISLLRVIIATLIIVFCEIFLTNQEQFWFKFGLYVFALLVVSYDVIFKVINRIVHLENFIDEYLLITLSAVGAITISTLYIVNGDQHTHELMDGVMVVLLFQVGKIIESIATNKSKNAVMTAIDSRAEVAHLIQKDEIYDVSPEDLNVGNLIIVKTGETIPVDGTIVQGEGFVDTSSLTGEYVPINVKEGSTLFSGCSLKSGTITMRVDKKYQESTVAKIINLISNSGEKKSKADQFITKFARVYTPLVLLTSISFILIHGFITFDWLTTVFKGLEILVVACPCAIVISVPLAYFSGIGLASKNGILIKGTNYLDEINELKKIITDKTGTLTKAVFEIQEIYSIDGDNEQLLKYLYAAESRSSHPIAKAICHGVNVSEFSINIEEYYELAGLGVECVYKDDIIVAGSAKLLEKNEISFEKVDKTGTIVYLSVNGKYLGYVLLNDEIKESASKFVESFAKNDIETILLTGDKENIAKDISNKLGIQKYHYELLPEDKVKYVEEEMRETKGKVAFIGDGINDAASIRLSDVGIAMGGIGSDVAVENADVVIMNDDPLKVYDAYKIAKTSRRTSIFNIVFSLLLKISVIVLVLLFDIPMFVAVLADTGLTVLMVLNSLLVLYRKI